MKQINKFKARMKNITRSSTEYRMTIEEAKNLLTEIEELENIIEKKPKIIEVEKIVIQSPISYTLDGGTF